MKTNLNTNRLLGLSLIEKLKDHGFSVFIEDGKIIVHLLDQENDVFNLNLLEGYIPGEHDDDDKIMDYCIRKILHYNISTLSSK